MPAVGHIVAARPEPARAERQTRTLFGVSIGWVGLSLISDLFPTLIVPARLAGTTPPAALATTVGVITSIALLAGMLAQPIAGAVSDRLRPRVRRRALVAAGALATCVGLASFGLAADTFALAAAFTLLAIAVGVMQAGQQGFIPDLIGTSRHGRAAGAKGVADVGGSFLGFAVVGVLLGVGLMGSARPWASAPV